MMIPHYGDFAEDDIVYMPFNTFTSDDPSASATITDLADADIHVYKDGSEVQATTDGATVNIDHDGVTGMHMITIDTSADAYYATGSEYAVSLQGTTIDGATGAVNVFIGSFSIERAGGVLALMKATTLASIKAETALIVADTNELQTDDYPTTIAALQTDLDTLTAGCTLAAGAIDNASLAGNMEIVFETDFATNYNQTDNAWVTNGTSFIGTGWNTGKTGYALTTQDWNVGKTGYSLTTADWNVGKTGYTLTPTTGLGAQTANITGSVSSVTGNVDGNVTGSVGSNLELGPAEVNTEVDNALNVTTYAEPAKGLPAATTTIQDKIGFLYKAWRNRSTQTATVYSLYNDDGTTVDHDATVSDDATTADKGEMTDGP